MEIYLYSRLHKLISTIPHLLVNIMTKQYRTRDEVSTVPTEDSSIVDSIISTFCCNGSYDSLQSYKDEVKTRREKEILRKKKAMEEHAASSPAIWERLSDLALFFVQGAPPVKLVTCFECSSVDESEVTTPPILREMAHEYDRKTKSKYNAISPADHVSTTTEGSEINPATSLKPLLLRYARNGLRLKNGGGGGGGGGGSISESKCASKLRAPSEKKQMVESSRKITDAKSATYSDKSSSGMRQNVRGKGERSVCDRSIATKKSEARSVENRRGKVPRRTDQNQRSTTGEKVTMSKRSKKSLKYEI